MRFLKFRIVFDEYKRMKITSIKCVNGVFDVDMQSNDSINVIVGPNGVGKSRFLEHISDILTNSNPRILSMMEGVKINLKMDKDNHVINFIVINVIVYSIFNSYDEIFHGDKTTNDYHITEKINDQKYSETKKNIRDQILTTKYTFLDNFVIQPNQQFNNLTTVIKNNILEFKNEIKNIIGCYNVTKKLLQELIIDFTEERKNILENDVSDYFEENDVLYPSKSSIKEMLTRTSKFRLYDEENIFLFAQVCGEIIKENIVSMGMFDTSFYEECKSFVQLKEKKDCNFKLSDVNECNKDEYDPTEVDKMNDVKTYRKIYKDRDFTNFFKRNEQIRNGNIFNDDHNLAELVKKDYKEITGKNVEIFDVGYENFIETEKKKLNKYLDKYTNINSGDYRLCGVTMLDPEFVNKEKDGKRYRCSSGEKELIMMLIELYYSGSSIIFVDEPFLKLCNQYKKRVQKVFFGCGKQIFCITHDSNLITQLENMNIYYFSQKNNITHCKTLDLVGKQKLFLERMEVFFSEKCLLVEGYSDYKFYGAVLELLDINDYNIVSCDGCGSKLPIILNELEIPYKVIYDTDAIGKNGVFSASKFLVMVKTNGIGKDVFPELNLNTKISIKKKYRTF